MSNEVAAELARRSGIAPAAARQRLSRAGGKVRKLAGIPFARNARFVYLEEQFGSPAYWNNLAASLIAHKSALGFAIAALRQYGGMVPAGRFPIICGAPLRQLKHLSADTVLQRLSEAGLVKTTIVPSLGECIALVQDEEFYGYAATEMRARLITEDVLLAAVKDWLRNLGIASYDRVRTREDAALPQVGTFAWDLSAPSYLGPMVRFGSDGASKPGFVACDVNLAGPITLAGAAPFIRKCTTLRALRRVGPCMQILVADHFNRDAFGALRSAGIVAATPAGLFGEEIARALHELTSVLTQAAYAVFDTEKFAELFRTLRRIEGATNQLRGALFEYIVADIAKRLYLGDVTMNRIFKVPGKGQAEIDVLAVRPNQQLLAIECKGYSPRAIIPDAMFARWLQHNVPTAHAYVRAHPEWRNLPVAFEFWSSASISAESHALFEKAQREINPNRYTIALRGPDDVYKACCDASDNGLFHAYNNHFTPPEGPLPPLWRPRSPAATAVPANDAAA